MPMTRTGDRFSQRAPKRKKPEQHIGTAGRSKKRGSGSAIVKAAAKQIGKKKNRIGSAIVYNKETNTTTRNGKTYKGFRDFKK